MEIAEVDMAELLVGWVKYASDEIGSHTSTEPDGCCRGKQWTW
jgi:hypothetical protein